MATGVEIVAQYDKYTGSVFKMPCNIIIFGGCYSGKTYFCQKLLEYKDIYFYNSPSNIVFFYKEYQKIYDELKLFFVDKIEFVKGVSNNKLRSVKNAICVYDDVLADINYDVIENFYARSQHSNLINLFLSQSVYYGESLKRIRKISNYFIFLNSVESGSIFRLMQNYLQKTELRKFKKYFNEIMDMSEYNHLICDFHPRTKNMLRYKFDIWEMVNSYSIEDYKIVKIRE
jgi:hypothetical protein